MDSDDLRSALRAKADRISAEDLVRTDMSAPARRTALTRVLPLTASLAAAAAGVLVAVTVIGHHDASPQASRSSATPSSPVTHAKVVSSEADCADAPATLAELVAHSDAVVVGTVRAERPLTERLPRSPTGVSSPTSSSPDRDLAILPRHLTVTVHRTISGKVSGPEITILNTGWIVEPDGTWDPSTINQNARLSVGDRAVLPLNQSADGTYYISCSTGAFILRDGQVAGTKNTDPINRAVEKLTVAELIASIEESTGRK